MATADELKKVNVRLERLEKRLDTVAKAPKTAELSAEDISAYHRVRTALWEDGTCGINETSPCVVQLCRGPIRICDIVCLRICRACDTECTCGPCGVYERASYGGRRFGDLGG